MTTDTADHPVRSRQVYARPVTFTRRSWPARPSRNKTLGVSHRKGSWIG